MVNSYPLKILWNFERAMKNEDCKMQNEQICLLSLSSLRARRAWQSHSLEIVKSVLILAFSGDCFVGLWPPRNDKSSAPVTSIDEESHA